MILIWFKLMRIIPPPTVRIASPLPISLIQWIYQVVNMFMGKLLIAAAVAALPKINVTSTKIIDGCSLGT